MRIIYMGTPVFAVHALKSIIESGHEVVAVFTQPDKAKGRSKSLVPTPVKEVALAHDIPVYQPVRLREEENVKCIKAYAPDAIVVAAYGQILSEDILNIPKYGCINIHASLLPAYRGAAPINWCILNGESKTGVTSMQMDKGLDTGDMLLRRETEIGENETYQELYDRLAVMGGEVLADTLKAVEEGTLSPEKQDDSLSCYSPMITKSMSALDFSKSAKELHNTVRGVTGFTLMGGKRLKIFRSVIENGTDEKAANGEIVDADKFTVKCGDGGLLTFTEIQAEGGKRMKTADFLRGKKITKGEILA